MSTITLKNVEPSLHEALKQAASTHHRSLNQEILIRVEQSLKSQPVNYALMNQRAAEVREQLNVYITDTELCDFKNEGRA
jgi:plasmid stability protein